MKIRSYCFTRNFQQDYCNFIIPDKGFDKHLSTIESLLIPIVGAEMKKKVWVLYKTPDVVFWGICCLNKDLSDSHFTEEANRLVKGFYAVCISEYEENELAVPFDVSFFKELFKEEVIPHWHSRQWPPYVSQVEWADFSSYHTITASSACEKQPELNTDPFKCKLLPLENVERVIAEALTKPSVTLAIGYDGSPGLFDNVEPFMNCMYDGAIERENPVMRKCPRCKNYVSKFSTVGICEDCVERKKAALNQPATPEPIREDEVELVEMPVEDIRGRGTDELDDESISDKNRGKNKIMKILCYVVIPGILFLLSLLFLSKRFGGLVSCSKTKDSVVEEENIKKPLFDIVQQQSASSEYYLTVKQDTFNIPAKGKDTLVISWETNYPEIKREISGFDWVKKIEEDTNSLTLKIRQNVSRQAKVAEVTLSADKDTVKAIIRQSEK